MSVNGITLGALIKTFSSVTDIKVRSGSRELTLREIVISLDRTVSNIFVTNNSTVIIKLDSTTIRKEEA